MCQVLLFNTVPYTVTNHSSFEEVSVHSHNMYYSTNLPSVQRFDYQEKRSDLTLATLLSQIWSYWKQRTAIHCTGTYCGWSQKTKNKIKVKHCLFVEFNLCWHFKIPVWCFCMAHYIISCWYKDYTTYTPPTSHLYNPTWSNTTPHKLYHKLDLRRLSFFSFWHCQRY